MTDPARDITLPVGLPRSGRARYGAAMALYQAGHLGAEALEIYRICSLLDTADPAPLLAAAGLPAAQLVTMTAEIAIRSLVAAADEVLATLPGPGVAEVRLGLNRWRDGAVTPHHGVHHGGTNAVLASHLPAALAALHVTHPDLAGAIAGAAPHLRWITYDLYGPEIGADFANGHAFASLIGEDGAIPARDFDLGLFLIAPHVLYRDHHHAAPELYVPLTGPHGWRFGPGRPLVVKPALLPVWNPPQRPHLTKVGPTPFLALYGWTRDVQAAASVIPATDWPALEALRLDP